jgi:hypothetical protein
MVDVIVGLGLRDQLKRDPSTAQPDTFARAKVKKKSGCFGRDDSFWVGGSG